MKARHFFGIIAAAPFLASLWALQSCAGQGGPLGGGIDPGLSAAFLALLPAAQKDAAYIGATGCTDNGCHGGRDEEVVYHQWIDTKHASVGTTCESCHGPGSVHRDGPAEDNILTFPKITSAVVCAQCHGKVYDEWRLSQHSKLITSPIMSAVQNPSTYARNSRCVSCHSGLWRTQIDEGGVDVPSMSNAEVQVIANNTLNDVPHTASCVTCHDPHSNTDYLSDDGKQVQLRHSVFNADTTEIGPGMPAATFTRFNQICAQCHNGRGANPADSALTSGTARPNMHDSNQFNMLMGIGGVEGSGPVIRNTAHANIPGQCSKCHMPDSRHSFTVSFDKGCNPCHTAADAAARTSVVKQEIVDKLYALRNRMNSWALATFGDEDMWEYTATITGEGKTPPNQTLVPIQVKRARHNYYFVLRDKCFGPHNFPYADHLIRIANENMDEVFASSASMPGRDAGMTYERKMAILLSDLERTKRAGWSEDD